jgi:hypothetical protein
MKINLPATRHPASGRLRNAQVTITDANGTSRTVLTSSAGHYEFEGMAPGRQYRVAVTSRPYRYEARTVEASSDLTEVDFMAQE